MSRLIHGALVLCLLFCCSPNVGKCQGLIETMTTQIAKLELYLQEAKQGYDMVQKGLSTISDIKNGDFNIHSAFFGSLKTVNPAIKHWSKVADIVNLEALIINGCSRSIKQFTGSTTFPPETIGYLTAVVTQLKDLTGKDVDELTGLLADGKWQMDDEERIHRIDGLYKTVIDKYNFLSSFSNQVAAMAHDMARQKANFQHLQSLNQP